MPRTVDIVRNVSGIMEPLTVCRRPVKQPHKKAVVTFRKTTSRQLPTSG